MGLMDKMKDFAGKNTQATGLVSGLQNFVTQSGGINGLKAKFEKEGAGSIIQSWIGTGQNLPISKEQVEKVMGNQFIQDVAKKMGVEPSVASEKLSHMLPTVIDKLTPNGQVPTNLDEKGFMSAASDLFKEH